jgi:tetratricopeptide (TPR) repeat protein
MQAGGTTTVDEGALGPGTSCQTSFLLVRRLRWVGVGVVPCTLLLVLLSLRCVYVPGRALAFAVSTFLVMFFPGLLLCYAVGARMRLSESLGVAFMTSFVILGVPGLILLQIHSDLQMLKWVLCATAVLLSTWCLSSMWRKWRASAPWTGLANPSRGRAQTALSVLLVVSVGVLLACFITTASMRRPSDRWGYAALVRHFLDTDHFLSRGFTVSDTTPIPQRAQAAVWELGIALIVELSGVQLEEAYSFYLPPVMIVMSSVALYALGVTVLGSRKTASVAVILHVAYCLTDIARQLPESLVVANTETGYAQLLRSQEDKFVLRFILLPVTQLIAWRFLTDGNARRHLPFLVCGAVSAVLVHPLGLVLVATSFALSAGVTLACRWSRGRMVRALLGLCVMVAAAVLPLVERAEFMSLQEVGFRFDPVGKASGLLIAGENPAVYMVHPLLATYHPIVLLSLLVVPVILVNVRNSTACQFVIANLASVVLLIYNPLVAPMVGRVITPNLLWRVNWLLPVVLTLALFGQLTVRRLRGLKSARWRKALAFSALALGLAPLPMLGARTAAGLQRLAESHLSGVSSEERDALTFLRAQGIPGSVVLAEHWMSLEIPSAVGHSYGVVFRQRPPLVPSARQDLLDFYGDGHLTTKHTDILVRLSARYVVLERTSSLVIAFQALSPAFREIYANDAYRVVEVAEGWRDDPRVRHLVAANTLYYSGDLEGAGEEYSRTLDVNPSNFWAYLQLGRIYETRGHLHQAEWAYRHCLEVKPLSEAYAGLGRVLDAAGLQREAASQFEKAASQEPENAEDFIRAAQARGDASFIRGELDEAARAYRFAAYASNCLRPELAAGERVYVPEGWPRLRSDWLRSMAGQAVTWPRARDCALPMSPPSMEAVTYEFPAPVDSNWDDTCFGDATGQSLFRIEAIPQVVLYQHPPSSCSYRVAVGSGSRLISDLALSPEVWTPDMGDGVKFDIRVSDGKATGHPLSKYIDPKHRQRDRRWHQVEVNLSEWAGRTVTITFATDSGPRGNADYDWAGWGEPRIVQPVAYDFLAEFPHSDSGGAGSDAVRMDALTVDYETRDILFQHPPSRVAYRVWIPDRSGLHFGLTLDPAVWSPEKSDGVEYNIYIRYPDDPYVLHRVFNRFLNPTHEPGDQRWVDSVVDLTPHGGHTVDVVFEALPGAAGSANYDWGGWSRPVLVADDSAVLNSRTY